MNRQRYLHFEQAFLAGELDPGFKNLSVWDYRFVSNGNETDEILAWGREMLRNYYPDHITNPDYRWRYVESVKTDVKYGSKDQVNDLPSLHGYAISARVVTVSPDQHLLVAANEAQQPADIAAPYTIGKWDKTPPVEVSLVKGRNVLHCSREGENIKGMTIKDFTLTPVK